jgi:hypothetical protein
MRRSLCALALACLALCAAPALASAQPEYAIEVLWGDTHLTIEDTLTGTDEAQLVIQVRNVGDMAGAEADLTIEDTLPKGVRVTDVYWSTSAKWNVDSHGDKCSVLDEGEQLRCELPAAEVPLLAPAASDDGLKSGFLPTIFADVSVPGKPAAETGTNLASVSGGGDLTPADEEDTIRFSAEPSPFGIVGGSFEADLYDAAFPAGEAVRLASARPFELRVGFDVTARTGVNSDPEGDTSRYITSNAEPRTFEATMPRGFLGNPEAVPKCDPADFAQTGASGISTACPASTQVGYIDVAVAIGTASYGRGGSLPNTNGFLNRVPIYNLEPPRGEVADLAFNTALVQAHIYPTPDPGSDYAIKAVSPNVSNAVTARAARVTLWGVPGDPAHDPLRAYPESPEGAIVYGSPWGSAPIRPFLTAPIDCGIENGGASIRVDSYEHPGSFTEAVRYPDPLNVTGCENPRFRFEPEISLQPTDRAAGAPTGLDVNLTVPQRDDEVTDATDLYATGGPEDDPRAFATPPVKKAVVTLPEGMTLNPSAAQGLAGCSSQQIGLGTDSSVGCPDASKYGTLTLRTPLFPPDAQPEGTLYVAKQSDNPFGSLLALYLVVEEPDRGILIKIPGRIDLDPLTGQITTTFDDLPQFPVSDMQMSIKGGVRAGLVNPATCGTKEIVATMYSWHDPGTPPR